MESEALLNARDILIQEEYGEVSPVVKKFMAADKGVKIQDDKELDKHHKSKFYKWEELVANTIPLGVLKARVIQMNIVINALEPDINSNVLFSYTTADSTIIEFTWQEAKEFICEAIRYRMNKPSYRKLEEQLENAIKQKDMKAVAKLSRMLGK